MPAKLLALLAATKGATVAAVVVLGAATMTVGATTPEVQDAVKTVMQTLSVQTTDQTNRSDCGGQPAVVAQRNAATKLIDAAWQDDHKGLDDLRGKGVDNQAAGDLIKTADDQLKELRTKALNDVAALTLGREGQNTASGSPAPSKSPKPSASGCPSDTPESAKPSASPKAEDSATPSQEGRVTVALRTTLDANIKTIVDAAVADMAGVLKDAQAKVGALPAADHGKPSNNPGNDHKPSGSPKP
jgi:hypothetical protein